MRANRLWIAALLAIAIGCGQAAEVKLDTDKQKTVYGIGAQIGANLKESLGTLELTPEETATLLAGLNDQVEGKGRIDLKDPAHEERLKAFQEERMKAQQERSKAQAETEVAESKTFIEKAAQEKGAEQLPSGLVYTEVEAGKGATPKETDVVKVHYHGTLRDGTVFDSSRDRGEPVEFPVNRVIPCWTEGLQKMKEGGKAKFVCPAPIAYGDQGRPPTIKPGAALAFEVELISIQKQATGAN